MIESGQMRMSFDYFDISSLLEGIMIEFKPHADKKNIRLELYSQNKKLELHGDQARLRQVFVNLISNAIKYTEKGYISVLIDEEDAYCTISVTDTGIGIDADDVDRIFERFYRVDKIRSKELGGTGLGLAIVKHILDAHNSKIKVKSKLHVGTKFSFMLKKRLIY